MYTGEISDRGGGAGHGEWYSLREMKVGTQSVNYSDTYGDVESVVFKNGVNCDKEEEEHRAC
jgi:hypothetical protein